MYKHAQEPDRDPLTRGTPDNQILLESRLAQRCPDVRPSDSRMQDTETATPSPHPPDLAVFRLSPSTGEPTGKGSQGMHTMAQEGLFLAPASAGRAWGQGERRGCQTVVDETQKKQPTVRSPLWRPEAPPTGQPGLLEEKTQREKRGISVSC